ncbi:hypothetical protein GJAV_G00113810 [Gymnothorax javanicus]|nr:hypothetical protein GJAV_G00113810 [Gymnothorax javanicus]
MLRPLESPFRSPRENSRSADLSDHIICSTPGCGNCNTTKAKSAGGCCVVYTKASKLQKLPLSVIKEYRVQEVTGSCHIPAVVFITQRNRQICANPKAKNVKQILRQLRGKKSNGKDGR